MRCTRGIPSWVQRSRRMTGSATHDSGSNVRHTSRKPLQTPSHPRSVPLGSLVWPSNVGYNPLAASAARSKSGSCCVGQRGCHGDFCAMRLRYAMCPKYSPLAMRCRASAFNSTATLGSTRPEAASESAPRSTQLPSMNPGASTST
jgi:hypothetical protein